tara:strand:- start:395 stop:616 length:222 start_codon:yes stop_codon:yes gene_type:complete
MGNWLNRENTDPIGAFLEPWWWNQFLMIYVTHQMIVCNAQGWWGELWYNDNGEMMNRCYEGYNGDVVNFEMVL